jgi:hypothetical protein
VPPVFPIKISSFNVISNYNLIKHATFLNWRDGADSNFREYLSTWLFKTLIYGAVLWLVKSSVNCQNFVVPYCVGAFLNVFIWS